MEVITFIVLPVVAFPYLAFIPVVYFARVYTKTKNKINLVTSLLWTGYGIYEGLIYYAVICGESCDIRIDLFPISIILLIFTILALFKRK